MSFPEIPPVQAMPFQSDHYPTPSHTATPALEGLIRARIAADGPLDFATFMGLALYHPESGYYARQTRQVGREGDFFTSVSVGPLFGRILAHRFLRGWRAAGSPPRWRIIEAGANDGSLAADILAEITTREPAAATALDYVIAEPLPHLRTIQQARLTGRSATARILAGPEPLAQDPLPGFAFGNEVLDALPCHALVVQQGAWRERRIALAENGGLTWHTDPSPLPDTLAAAIAGVGTDFPEGYLCEVRVNHRDFLAPLRDGLTLGRMVFFDYGFARPEFFHPGRACGTLRTYSKHRAGDDPLADPGSRDLTAHVDFTAVANAGIDLGCPPVRYQSQSAWLTTEARELLMELDGRPDPETVRQFQTLTHPAQLGARFQVLELSCGEDSPTLPASDRHRLALRPCTETDPR